MAAFKPELHNAEAVMAYYENSNAICFKVYAGTTPKAEYCRYVFDDDEKQIGSEKLAEALQAIEQNSDNTNPYLLQLIERKKGSKNQKDETMTQIVFQLNRPEKFYGIGSYQQSSSDPEMRNMMKQMMENQNLLITKLSADELEEEIPEDKPKSLLAGIIENENFQQMAIAAIGALVSKIMNPQQPVMNHNYSQGIAGIPEQQEDVQHQKAMQALELLSQKDDNYGDHLLYLANVPQKTYEMLLTFVK